MYTDAQESLVFPEKADHNMLCFAAGIRDGKGNFLLKNKKYVPYFRHVIDFLGALCYNSNTLRAETGACGCSFRLLSLRIYRLEIDAND